MRIALASLASASRCFDEWKPDAILSAVSPSMRSVVPSRDGVRHLRLFSHDLEVAKLRSLTGPSPRQVEAAIAFFREPHERLLIHCGFGLSRAPAYALIALVVGGYAPADARAALMAATASAQPNRRILRVGDALLGCGGALAGEASAFTYRRAATGARGLPIKWVEIKSTETAAGGSRREDAPGRREEIYRPVRPPHEAGCGEILGSSLGVAARR